jgi:hypothetical protein
MVMLKGLVLAALLLAAAPAAAQDRLDAAAAAIDRAIAQPKAEATGVERMSAFLKVAPGALRAQRADAQVGWGDFFIAQRIAARGGHPVDKVFAARRTGVGWTEIADEANVSPDAVVQDVAIVWPDAAKAAAQPAPPGSAPARSGATPPAAATPAPEQPKGLGAKMRDLFGGSSTAPADEGKSTSPPADDMRDKMIRGGGKSR